MRVQLDAVAMFVTAIGIILLSLAVGYSLGSTANTVKLRGNCGLDRIDDLKAGYYALKADAS